MTSRMLLAICMCTLMAAEVAAKVDLVTLPEGQKLQLTIYNSADLTLVRDMRSLTLKKGNNELQFSWAGTLIDPTSLDIFPQKYSKKIDVFDITYPPRVKNLGLWHIRSKISKSVPVEISYFTSGLSWRAFYLGTLSRDERKMNLEGYVRVTNNSGEDYPEAQTRLIVGKINLLDRIAQLAQRQFPYGSPQTSPPPPPVYAPRSAPRRRSYSKAKKELSHHRPKEIKKESLSEYFLYTIEGKETIRNGWSKRLPSFKVGSVPVKNLYKYEQQRYGANVYRFLSFKNDKKHKLGQTPIPNGTVKVFRSVDRKEHLSYTGQSSFKYIPINEDIELNLGVASDVKVKPTLMKYETTNFMFDGNGNISGFEEVTTYEVEVSNFRDIEIKVEILLNFRDQYFKLEKSGKHGKFEQVDLDTVKFTLELPKHKTNKFTYVHTQLHGQRRN